jgi:V/A-type H+/Na+-transporting ATPase subunit E
MEADITKLIEQIKQDGVEQAQAEAAKIIKDANVAAEEMIEQAREEGRNIIAHANKQAENL